VRRGYKSNIEYWSTEIRESRRRKIKLSAAPDVEIPAEINSESVLDIENLSAVEIKEKLKELGVQTCVQKLEKVQDILKHALTR
jgi:hypothetical protein